VASKSSRTCNRTPPTSSTIPSLADAVLGTTRANTGALGAGAAAFIHEYADDGVTPIRFATSPALAPEIADASTM
jgi:hypothetical protein